MRFPKPFFRASKDAWYVQLGKRQISLPLDQQRQLAVQFCPSLSAAVLVPQLAS